MQGPSPCHEILGELGPRIHVVLDTIFVDSPPIFAQRKLYDKFDVAGIARLTSKSLANGVSTAEACGFGLQPQI